MLDGCVGQPCRSFDLELISPKILSALNPFSFVASLNAPFQPPSQKLAMHTVALISLL